MLNVWERAGWQEKTSLFIRAEQQPVSSDKCKDVFIQVKKKKSLLLFRNKYDFSWLQNLKRRVWSQRETFALISHPTNPKEPKTAGKAWFDETSSFTKKENPSMCLSGRMQTITWQPLPGGGGGQPEKTSAKQHFKDNWRSFTKFNHPEAHKDLQVSVRQTVSQVNLTVSQRDNKEDGGSSGWTE